MQQEKKDFLTLALPPARLTITETAWFLGFAENDISVLISAGLLKPLGHPPPGVRAIGRRDRAAPGQTGQHDSTTAVDAIATNASCVDPAAFRLGDPGERPALAVQPARL